MQRNAKTGYVNQIMMKNTIQVEPLQNRDFEGFKKIPSIRKIASTKKISRQSSKELESQTMESPCVEYGVQHSTITKLSDTKRLFDVAKQHYSKRDRAQAKFERAGSPKTSTPGDFSVD